MADSTYRSNRDRDAAQWQGDDPLAELARLIGQSEPARPPRSARRDPVVAEPSGGFDWSSQDRYADARANVQSAPAEPDYSYEEDPRTAAYEPVRASEAPAAYAADANYDDGYEDAGAPAPQLESDAYGRHRALAEQPYRAMSAPVEAGGRTPPDLLPRLAEELHGGEVEDVAQDDYALEDYDDAPPRRRGGLVAIAAVLGLAVLGTAGAFGYRAMFGSSMLPALPPIIKADSGPIKIVPKPKANSADEAADASTASTGEKLVSREEQPVVMPTPPANPGPRVVATVPIFPDPQSGQGGVPAAAQQAMQSGALAAATSNIPARPPVGEVVANQAGSIWPPAPAGSPAASVPPMTPTASTGETKKIHTVVVHATEVASADAAVPASEPVPAPVAAPPPTPSRAAPVRATAAPAARPAPMPHADANAPLSIVPNQGAAEPRQAAPRVRTAAVRPAEAPPSPRSEAAPASGGYAVQVTAQRSEAEAEAEFRSLRAKYPTALGGREPMVRRADLGAKGVYYRALVGPFGSETEAVSMCSRLKAAGGSCLVQRI